MLALSPEAHCDWPCYEGSELRPCPGDLGAEEEKEPSVLSPRRPHLGELRAGVRAAISSCDEWGAALGILAGKQWDLGLSLVGAQEGHRSGKSE